MEDAEVPERRTVAPVAWLFAASLALRLAFVARVHEPVLFADEAAPFLIARTLVGHHPTPTMGNDAFYHAGYALLLAPWTALLGFAGTWRAATVVNAVLLAAMVPLLHRIARDVLGARPPLALAAAAVAGLYPSFVLEAGLTWSESAVLPAVLLTFVLCSRLVRRPTAGSAIAFGASTVWAYAVHPRLVPLVVLGLVALWLAARRGDLPTTGAAAGTVAVVVGVLAVRLLHGWLRGRLYLDTPGSDEQEVVTRLFRDPANALHALAAFVGQTWYLSVATFGLVPLGAWELARQVRRTPRRLDLLFVVASVASLLAVSSLFVIDPKRVDQRVYGRYAETFIAVLLVAGIVALGRARRRISAAGLLAVVAVPVVLGVGLLVGVGSEDLRGVVNPLNILGIDQVVLLHQRVDVVAITALAVAAGLVVLAVRAIPRFGAPLALVLVGALFTASFLRTEGSMVEPVHATRRLTSVVPARLHDVERLADVDVHDVDIAYVAGQHGGEFFGYQLLLPDIAFHPFDPEVVPRGPWVLAGKSWPLGVAAGARLVVPEGIVDSALWVLPGPAQDRVAAAGIAPSADAATPLGATDLRARVTAKRTHVDVPSSVDPVRLPVVVRHRGRRPWPASADAPAAGATVRLEAEWLRPSGDEVVWASLVDLPHRVFPTEQVALSVPLVTIAGDGARLPRGTYRLRFALVQQGAAPVPVDGTAVTVEVR